MAASNILPIAIETSVNFPKVKGTISAILKDLTLKLGHFTNFKVLFPAISTDLHYLLYQHLSRGHMSNFCLLR